MGQVFLLGIDYGPWLSGDEAFRFGLVNQVVPAGKLIETAEEMAG